MSAVRVAPPGLHRIVNTVAELYGLPPEQVRSRRQDRPYVDARHVAMWLASDYGYSLQQIGKLGFRGRHHTSVMHAIRKIARALDTHEDLRAFIAECRAKLGEARPRNITDRVYVPEMRETGAAQEGAA